MTDKAPEAMTPMLAAMQFNADAEHGKVFIERRGKPGKWYPTVALRVEAFRRFFQTAYGLVTEQLTREGDDPDIVVMRATVIHYHAQGATHGRPVATGHAEEIRGKGTVNQTSALENCETSAIGRALAAFGLVGDEMASAQEMEQAIHEQQKPRATAEQTGELIQLCRAHGMDDAAIAQYLSTLRIADWADLTEERADRLLEKMRKKYSEEQAADAADERTDAAGSHYGTT